ncbi:MAG: 2-oxo acid dehydrogenase subunit E2 [Anaerolineae bacterium]|nr:2-oxo acid dehydrogenase subunit E2 [Anaerolineae bacterium]
MGTKIIMPEMGEGIIEAVVAQWLKAEGDRVEQYDPILEIETDKVTTEATAEDAGTLLKIYVEAGTTVEVGTLLGFIGQPGELEQEQEEEQEFPQAAAEPEVGELSRTIEAKATYAPKPKGMNGSPQSAKARYTGRISPVVGRIAAENEVDLDLVTGTGEAGRITKRDILAYLEKREVVGGETAVIAPPPPAPKPTPPPAPAVPQSPPPAGEILPLTAMRRGIADHMVRSKHTSPHVTTIFEFDFTAVAKHRAANKAQFASDGARLTFTAYIVAATVAALKKHPLVNSTWTDDGIRLLRDINLGMATALDEGLIVPVIKNADSLNLLGLARVINDLAQRARNKQLRPDEVQGGTFTLTNHGVSGSLFANPIINQPQCGILGVGMIEKRVKVINDAIAIRPMAYVGLTFDHRILDGATADYFVASIKETIENWV